jgi:STE24 endopeptidase
MAIQSADRAWVSALALAGAAAGAAALALRPRGRVIRPASVAASDYFDAADIERARRFERPQRAIGTASGLVGALTLTVALQAARPLQRRSARAALAEGAALSLVLTVVELPLGALGRKRALEAGIATGSWRVWVNDGLCSAALGTAFAGAGAAGLRLLMNRFAGRWWLVAAGGSVVVATLGTFAAPVLIEPIFNDFTPLPDGELRSSVLALASRAGVRVGGVYSVDASRRTSQVNAYVGGIGATRRVVLFDTLLASFTTLETDLVVAHELAHVRHRDVPRGLLFAAIVAVPGAHAVARVAERLDAAAGRAEPTSLPALALAGAVVGAVVGPFARAFSRAIERRADGFALELTGDAETFIGFEQRVTRANLADPDPPRWRSRLFATHPPAVERIGAALACRAEVLPPA